MNFLFDKLLNYLMIAIYVVMAVLFAFEVIESSPGASTILLIGLAFMSFCYGNTIIENNELRKQLEKET